MLVRFVVLQQDECSHVAQGLFHATESLRSVGQLDRLEEDRVAKVFAWFNRHLPHPTRFARSTRRHAQAKAVSWFKHSAGEFISRIEELAPVLMAHGHVVQRLITDRPGYVVYEDAYQVVAEPFRGRRGMRRAEKAVTGLLLNLITKE